MIEMNVDIIVILCKMEQIFSPAFFDVVVRHLPREAKIKGPIQNYLMHPMEKTLGKHKKRVRNKA
jgi:hypothetical protein